ncbi:MAG TPA: hypothetical protein VNS32_27865, partial [Flavisolibacter sp.]|nr:hypothetical protein [Flavisolibacter sp.]
DATDDITPASMIPTGLLNTTGFLVDRKNFGFVHLIDNTKSRMYRIDINGMYIVKTKWTFL